MSIIDFGDFGQLFFSIYTADGKKKGAMNNPIVIILKNAATDPPVRVIRVNKDAVKNEERSLRRSKAIEFARDTFNGVERVGVKFFTIDSDYFYDTIDNGWLLERPELLKLRNKISNLDGISISSLFNMDQGVTTGKNLPYILTEEKAKELIHEGLTFRLVRGRDINAWNVQPSKEYIIYPYKKIDGVWDLAFKVNNLDKLNLSIPISDEEKNMSVEERLNHRIAQGLIEFPLTALHLLSNYQNLKKRKYEGKFIEEYAGSWYAFHRPRNPEIMMSYPKILTPRLTNRVSFALDKNGFIPLDSVIALAPKENLVRFHMEFSSRIGYEFGLDNLLYVITAFLNSPIGNFLLAVGRPRTPKGDYSIDEKLLSDFNIPPVEMLVNQIETTKKLLEVINTKDIRDFDVITRLVFEIYSNTLGISKAEINMISEWNEELETA